MKILQIIPTLGSGGAERFVFELSNELCRQGHEVEILTLYHVPNNNPLRKSLNAKIQLFSLKKKNGLELRLFYSVLQLIKHGKYDVVHGHVGAIKYMVLAALICRKVKYVATIHSEAKREAGRSIDKWSRKLMFGQWLCVPVTISEESEISFERFYGIKGEMIRNGVSNYEKKQEVVLKDHEGQVVFLHPASCQPVKNQQLLFEAFNELIKNDVDAKLVWIGSNSSYLALFDTLKPLMQHNIQYLGVVDNVRDYMVASDAVCLSSKMEGMPMTIIEAFSVGCPVICTPVGGCKNMIHNGENGLLSDDLTTDSYYNTMQLFIKMSDEKKKSIKEESLASFDNYSIEECANNYLHIYKQSYLTSHKKQRNINIWR